MPLLRLLFILKATGLEFNPSSRLFLCRYSRKIAVAEVTTECDREHHGIL